MADRYEYDWSMLEDLNAYKVWAAALKAGEQVAVARGLPSKTEASEITVGLISKRVPGDPTAPIEVTVDKVATTYRDGGAFGAHRWEEDTPTASLTGARRILLPLRKVEEPPASAPTPSDYTVSVVDSPVRVEIVGGRALVRSPIYEPFREWANTRTKWDKTAKAWPFDVRDLETLRAKLLELYGADGSEERIRAVDVRVSMGVAKIPKWYFLGREVASLTPYGNLRTADSVVVISGELTNPSGKKIGYTKGTVIEVRGVPLAFAWAFCEAQGWRGVSLVKRSERVESLLDQGQRRPAAALSAVADDGLPPMRPGKKGAVSTAALIRRAEDFGALDDAMVALAALPERTLRPQLQLMRRALIERAPQVRELLLSLDGDWWDGRAASPLAGERLARVIERWASVAIGETKAEEEIERVIAPGLLQLFVAWQSEQLLGSSAAAPTSATEVSAPDSEQADEQADEQLDTRDIEETPAPKKRTRKPPLLSKTKIRGADIMLPAEVPFALLDRSPVSAEDVRRLRATLELTTTQFGVLLGSSRQRVYVWETEGTASAHPTVSVLIRLYLAQLPPVEELVEQLDRLLDAPAAIDEQFAEEVPAEVAPIAEAAAPERAVRGGVHGFGWWREESWQDQAWHLYYKTPYQADVARALERTPQAVWDRDSKRWELPDTEESVQLLEGLVRAHWGFDLGDVEYLHIGKVSRSYRVTPGSLWEIARPGKRAPDGAWGRVLDSHTYLEQSQGWDDGWHCEVWVRRVGEEDADARVKIQEARDAAATASRSLAEQAEQADALKERWRAAGLAPISPGDKLAEGLPAYLWRRVLHQQLQEDGRRYVDYDEASVTHQGQEWLLGRVWSHLPADHDELWAPRELLRSAHGLNEQPPVIEGTQRSVWACDRREDARRVGTTQLTFVRDELGDEWMAAVVLTRVGELRRDRDREAAPGQARYSYDVEYRAATEEEIAELQEPEWLKKRIGKRKV